MCIGLGLLFKHRPLAKQRMLCDAAPSTADTLETVLASWTGVCHCVNFAAYVSHHLLLPAAPLHADVTHEANTLPRADFTISA